MPNSLLDPSHQYYVIKEKFWDWGSGDIYDESGNTIGKMKRKILSLRSEISVLDVGDIPLFTVNKKIVSLRPSYDIKDSLGSMLGRTKKKFMTLFRPKMWLEDKTGNKVLVGQGSFAGWDFDIRDISGKKLAEVSKSDRWRDVFLGGVFDFADTYSLHILDKSYDKRLLIGFVIAIDNSVHDKR